MKRLLIIHCMLLICSRSMAQSAMDTGRTGINGNWDPADPNCPCFLVQKKAEKEYALMMGNEAKLMPMVAAPERKKVKMKVSSVKRRKWRRGRVVCP